MGLDPIDLVLIPGSPFQIIIPRIWYTVVITGLSYKIKTSSLALAVLYYISSPLHIPHFWHFVLWFGSYSPELLSWWLWCWPEPRDRLLMVVLQIFPGSDCFLPSNHPACPSCCDMIMLPLDTRAQLWHSKI